MRRLHVLPLALVLAVVVAAPAHAGGWATVGLSSTPEGTSSGTPWKPDITVLQHGRTPLEGVQPVVMIRNSKGTVKRFVAKATGKPGVYRAEVVFPSTGRWEYIVDDGFGNAGAEGHTFAPVTISDAGSAASGGSTAADDDGFPYGLVFGLAGAALVLAAGSTLVLRRRRGGIAPA